MQIDPLPLSTFDRVYAEITREMERQTWDMLSGRPLNPTLIQGPTRTSSVFAPEAPLSVAEIAREREAVASGPCGIAMNRRLVQDAERALAIRPSSAWAPLQSLLGTPLVDDADLSDGVAYVFYDRGLWRAYLQHLADRRDARLAVTEAKSILAEAHARDRQRRLAAPFRFEAYVESGLIVEARFNATARDQ